MCSSFPAGFDTGAGLFGDGSWGGSAAFHPVDVGRRSKTPTSPGHENAGVSVSKPGGVSQPSVITKIDPQYSEIARIAKYSCTVLLSIVVDAQGIPGNLNLVRGCGYGLDEKAQKPFFCGASSRARKMTNRFECARQLKSISSFFELQAPAQYTIGSNSVRSRGRSKRAPLVSSHFERAHYLLVYTEMKPSNHRLEFHAIPWRVVVHHTCLPFRHESVSVTRLFREPIAQHCGTKQKAPGLRRGLLLM